MLRIIGLIIFITSIMVGIGSNIQTFIDPPSLLIILGGTIGMLLLGGSSIGNMFSAVFSSDATPDQLNAAARGWGLARRYSVASGIIGTVIGAVIMLKYFDDMAALGPGAAICILTILYSVILGYGIYLPLQSRLEDRASGG